MKKLCICLLLILTLCLTACGDDGGDGGTGAQLPQQNHGGTEALEPQPVEPDVTDASGEGNVVSVSGDDLTAADLLGCWVMTEDNIYDPADFAFTATLDFYENDVGMIRVNYLQQDEEGGKVRFDEADMPVTFLEGALYASCPNQSWYVELERTSDHPNDDTAFSAALIVLSISKGHTAF